MFNIGAGEMVLILVAALLILGPQRLPELARGIGKFMREFRRQTDEVRNVVEREFYTMDQEFQRPQDAAPPVRPGTFANPPAPAAPLTALPPPDAEAPASPGAEAPSLAAEPPAAVHLAPQVLALDENGPRELEPAALQPQTPSPSGAVEAESSAPPTLAPLPGTVARNAPKRS
ncbi:MAG TPA: twin-arginine translocase TatA/TatE family subunit [Myxococcus sp.]|nr:twin-arginine translocase TatA/TatE family subunit [Myxococcus sp.]